MTYRLRPSAAAERTVEALWLRRIWSAELTLYASANDKALNKSFDLLGSPRAGLASANLLLTKCIETINVSGLDTDFFGHPYYGDHLLVLGDLKGIVRLHQSPSERGLRERAKIGLPYWEFVP